MEDLKFSKEKLALLKDKDLNSIVGGVDDPYHSCAKKSCNDDDEGIEV